jgi:DNA polymerase III alpha subunit
MSGPAQISPLTDNPAISPTSDQTRAATPPIIPLFSTSASRKQGGIFTVDKAGELAKQKRTKGPVSLCDLAVAEKLDHIHLVDSNFVSFFNASKNLKAVKCQLSFGLKLTICENMADKSEASIKTESNVIIWMAGDGDADYRALIAIFTKAATDGFYYVPRLDWPTLCAMWHSDLRLSLPFYSSFLARNTLTFCSIVPKLPVEKPIVLREIRQQLPFDFLLDDAVNRYAETTGAEVQPVKSIYYRTRTDAKPWMIWRCALGHSTWDKPELEFCCSREFCWSAYRELVAKPAQEVAA